MHLYIQIKDYTIYFLFVFFFASPNLSQQMFDRYFAENFLPLRPGV